MVLQCKVATLLTPPAAKGLGCGEEAPFSLLRTTCGVAGAEAGGATAGEGPREERGSCSEEEGGAAAVSLGEQMEGSETLLVKAGGWSWACEASEELWSELEDRLSMLRAGEGEQEEGRD